MDFPLQSIVIYNGNSEHYTWILKVFNFQSIDLRAQTICLLAVCFKTCLLCLYYRFRTFLSVCDPWDRNNRIFSSQTPSSLPFSNNRFQIYFSDFRLRYGAAPNIPRAPSVRIPSFFFCRQVHGSYFTEKILEVPKATPVSYTHLTLPTNREV